MAHWLQTQYPQIIDMAPSLKGKTVVWTIGVSNFYLDDNQDTMNQNYSLGPKNFIKYLKIGFPFEDTFDNFLRHYFSEYTLFLKTNQIKKVRERYLKKHYSK